MIFIKFRSNLLWTAKYALRRKRGSRRPFCVAKCFDQWTAKINAAVEDRFAKQSSEYDAAAVGSFAKQSSDHTKVRGFKGKALRYLQ